MPTSKQFETIIDIKAQEDPSVARVLGLTVRELEKFKKSVAEVQRMSAQMNKLTNGFIEPESLKKSATYAKELEKSFSGMNGVVSGVFGGAGFFAMQQFFSTAIARAGDLANEMKKSSDIAAMFEYQRKQLQIEAGFSNTGLNKAVDDMVRNSAKVPVTVATQEQVLRVLMGSMPGTSGDAKYEAAKKYASEITDLAAITLPAGDGLGSNVEALNEHTKALAETFAKARASGVTLQSNLRPLYNAGIPILPLLAEEQGLMPAGITADNFDTLPRDKQDQIEGQLAKLIKKRNLYEDNLFTALDTLTSGAGSEHR
jgi:hypothetical protein